MRKSQKPSASVDANVHQPRSQGIFHEAEFARDIFQLISILRFLVVTTVLLHGKERQGKLADLSSLPFKTFNAHFEGKNSVRYSSLASKRNGDLFRNFQLKGNAFKRKLFFQSAVHSDHSL